MNLELRHLRYVVAVADALNFTRAARQLHMSQPALSARIRSVERHLGVALFQRTTRTVALTPAGADFAERAREILRLLGEAERECRNSAHGTVLRVGFYGAAAREATTAIIDSFRDGHPGVEVELVRYGWEDPSAGLRAHEVQLSFVRPPFDADGLRLLILSSEPRVAGLPSGHPLADRATVDVSELLDEPVVYRVTGDRIWADYWYGADARAGTPPPRRIEVRNLDDELQAVAAGRAITLTTSTAVTYFPRPGVTYVPLTGLPPSRMALAWHPDDPNPLTHAFIDAAKAVCHAAVSTP
ncbi:LysR family transcriptional regulator [Nocardia sp. ET3-3]|uniref:LysR family transcriptional regulator n=1 Tax=Nocardia terrae TaxID=2675851 RepID=A0A7K1UST0_9NOCA|nr:LysR family transcriptional regulator [Nocardia terrae]MVU77385.1 LysR family transcriptional regulator [Nocardia terrae]